MCLKNEKPFLQFTPATAAEQVLWVGRVIDRWKITRKVERKRWGTVDCDLGFRKKNKLTFNGQVESLLGPISQLLKLFSLLPKKFPTFVSIVCMNAKKLNFKTSPSRTTELSLKSRSDSQDYSFLQVLEILIIESEYNSPHLDSMRLIVIPPEWALFLKNHFQLERMNFPYIPSIIAIASEAHINQQYAQLSTFVE